MEAPTERESTSPKDDATLERTSEREMVVTRTVNGPARLVFEAWTTPELFERWWVPKSFPISLLSSELDVRVGGRYRLVFGYEGSTMEFFGRYLEVMPPTRLVWTNEEGEEDGPISSVNFEETGGRTLVVVHELYPSKDALDAAMASGSAGIAAMPESLRQLDELLAQLGTETGRS
jgi:uncharacterized protein YndB with AHSA1/START domain